MALFRQPVRQLTFGGTAPNIFNWTISNDLVAFFTGQISVRPQQTFNPNPDPEWGDEYVDPGTFPFFAMATQASAITQVSSVTEVYTGTFYCSNPDPVTDYIGNESGGIRPFAGSFDISGSYYGSYTSDRGYGYYPSAYQHCIFEDPENPGSYSLLANLSQHPLGIFPYLSVPNWRWYEYDPETYQNIQHDENSCDSNFLFYEFDTEDPTDKTKWGFYVCRFHNEVNQSTGKADKNARITYVPRSSLGEAAQANFDILWDAIFNIPPDPPAPPFEPGEGDEGPYDSQKTTGQVGGDEYVARGTDTIDQGDLPQTTGLGTGFFTVYCMGNSESELNDMATQLWSDSFWDDLKEYYASPSDVIIGLYMLPFTPDVNQVSDTPEIIKAGRFEFDNPGARGNRMLKRNAEIDFGEIDIEPIFNSYIDYDKYTKVKLVLPFIGEFQLNTHELMETISNRYITVGEDTVSEAYISGKGSTLSLTYCIDYFTGIVTALVKINGTLKYQFSGNCKIDLPFTYGVNAAAIQQTSNFFGAALAAVGALAGAILTTGAGAPAFVAAAADVAAVTTGVNAVYQGAKSIAALELGSQGHVNGQLGGLAGMLQGKYPYLEITRPNIAWPDDMQNYTGMATYQQNELGKVDSSTNAGGFLSAESVQLEGFNGTDAERSELLRILKEGVVL